MARFNGFPPQTLDFLRRLADNNRADWFADHRTQYEQDYVEPAKAFVMRILGSISRINRDIRFSKDKRPYKDHLDFWFWEGERKHAVSGFFVRVSPSLVGIGAGCHGFDRVQLQAFKRAASDPVGQASLRDVGSQLAGAGYRLAGEPTVASRFLYVHVDEPAAVALTITLLHTCAAHWRRLAPLHRGLTDRVQRPLDPTL